MASEYFQAASWDREVLWQMYRLNNYPTQPQTPSDDEASQQMYGRELPEVSEYILCESFMRHCRLLGRLVFLERPYPHCMLGRLVMLPEGQQYKPSLFPEGLKNLPRRRSKVLYFSYMFGEGKGKGNLSSAGEHRIWALLLLSCVSGKMGGMEEEGASGEDIINDRICENCFSHSLLTYLPWHVFALGHLSRHGGVKMHFFM